MKLNASKCSVMQISFCKQPVQQAALFIDDTQLCNVESPKILGLIVQSDLKWNKHVTDLLKRSNKKLYILRRLKSFKLPIVDLITIFRGYIRPIVEYCAPVFNGALTKQHIYALESIQKRACRIILGSSYTSYNVALETCNLVTLEERRKQLCLTFAHNLEENPFSLNWLVKKQESRYCLRRTTKYTQYKCKTNRFRKSAIPYLIDLLNNE